MWTMCCSSRKVPVVVIRICDLGIWGDVGQGTRCWSLWWPGFFVVLEDIGLVTWSRRIV
ncbi:hypothetical protein M758_1G047200 [Ceratodon purpureus]|uniref:Uncharacterized protein n=1 Tax=Ceratodon purpureus TaxID=3225 RepID=A0A8T0J439_CERPU|nr:hypothetical protein KC19_1G050400 [Ceratodon purpureus]KAG0628714.1 hypothetical protein M758_1G047200 [Ceratodon purpureus]